MREHARRKRIAEIVSCGDRLFDPSTGLLHAPEDAAGGVVSSAGDGALLCYALGLLELSDRSRQGRAEAIIASAVRDYPAAPDQGESVAAGMALLLIWHRHRHLLSTGVAGALMNRLVRSVPDMAGCDGIGEGGVTGIPVLCLAFAVGAARRDGGMMATALDGLARVRCPKPPDIEDRALYLSCLYIARTHADGSVRAHELTSRLIGALWAFDLDFGPTGPRVCPDLIRALLENGTDVEIAGGPVSGIRPLSAVNAYVVTVEHREIPKEWVKRLRTSRMVAVGAERNSVICPA